MKRIKRVIPTESLRFSFFRHGKYDIEVTKLAKTCDDNSEKSFSDVLNETCNNKVKRMINIHFFYFFNLCRPRC